MPTEGASPAIGTVGKIEEIEEDSIEVVCEKEISREVIGAIRKVHPYEEMAIEISPLLELD